MEEMELLGAVSELVGTNSQIAEYQSNIKFFDEIENFLLGNFDKNGKYVIPENIATELVKLKKIYLYAFGEMAFCESEYAFDKIGNIQFAVKMNKDGKNMTAKLCIIQEIKRANGIYKKTAVTEISEISAPNSPSFVNDCFEKFNIHSKKEDGLQKTEFQQLDAQMTLNRLKYLSQKYRQLDAQEAAFKDLVEKKLALLAKYKSGKKVIDLYNAMLKKERLGKFIPGSKACYRNLNALLDKLVEEHKAELLNDTMLVTQWGKLNANASTKIRGEVLKDIFSNDLEEDKKPETSVVPTKVESIPSQKPKLEESKNDGKTKDDGLGRFHGLRPHGPHHHGPRPFGPGGPHHDPIVPPVPDRDDEELSRDVAMDLVYGTEDEKKEEKSVLDIEDEPTEIPVDEKDSKNEDELTR